MSNKLMWMKTIVPLKHCPWWQRRINSPELTGCVIIFVVLENKLLFYSTPSLGAIEEQQHRVKGRQMISEGNRLLYEQIFATCNIFQTL